MERMDEREEDRRDVRTYMVRQEGSLIDCEFVVWMAWCLLFFSFSLLEGWRRVRERKSGIATETCCLISGFVSPTPILSQKRPNRETYLSVKLFPKPGDVHVPPPSNSPADLSRRTNCQHESEGCLRIYLG